MKSEPSGDIEKLSKLKVHTQDAVGLPTRSMLEAHIAWTELQQSSSAIRRDFDNLRNRYDVIISSNPQHADAFLMRGAVNKVIFERYGDTYALQSALVDLRTYVKMRMDFDNDRSLPGAMLAMATIYIEMKDYDKARATLSKVEVRWPTSADSKTAKLLLLSIGSK